jgi:hypothetical protein
VHSPPPYPPLRGGGQNIIGMTPQEHTDQINEIFKTASAKLKDLKLQQDNIMKAYIQELEERKLKALSNTIKSNY